MEIPTYDLRTVADFYQVPDDRLDDCLAEFATAIRLQRAMNDLINAVGHEMHGVERCVDLVGEKFQWIDDGQRNMTVNIIPAEAQSQ